MSTETLAVTGFAAFFVGAALGSSALSRHARRSLKHGLADDFHCYPGLELWEYQDGGGFHHGISFAFLWNALLAIVVGGLLNPDLPDLLPLAVMLVVTVVVGLRMSRAQPSPIL